MNPPADTIHMMKVWENVVVGTGPAGIGALEGLGDAEVLLIDAGPSPTELSGPESLDSAVEPGSVSPKLRGSEFATLRNGDEVTFTGPRIKRILRLAESPGGFSTAWGAQMFPYTQDDLDSVGDWPIRAEHLAEPYRRFLSSTEFVGGSLATEQYFGHIAAARAAPMPLGRFSEKLLSRAEQRPGGKLVLAPALLALDRVIESPHFYSSVGSEFSKFNPTGMMTALNLLTGKERSVSHKWSTRVVGFQESSDYVEVRVKTKDAREESIRTRRLYLAMGTLATTKLILREFGGESYALPFVEHTPELLPVFDPEFPHGISEEALTFPITLNGNLRTPCGDAMVSVYNLSSAPLRDLLPEFGALGRFADRYFHRHLPSFAVAQIWQRSIWDGKSTVLLSGGRLTVESHYKVGRKFASLAAKEFRRLGFFASPMVSRSLGPGWGYHWVGTLPMREKPGVFETHTDGKLWDSGRVHVVDGSVLPSLPSKNHSFTILANAYRIARLL